MSVRPWRAKIRFYKTGKMGPGNLGAENLGSRRQKKKNIYKGVVPIGKFSLLGFGRIFKLIW